MKAKVLFGLVTALLLMNIAWNPADSPRPTLLGGVTAHAGVRVDFGFFYTELAPYGNWRQIEPYGWAWYPDVAEDWRPYTVGYWVFTDDYGWTWISKDSWGSIPYHYGRWFYDEGHGGWAWVPDTEWGPAWVGWRSGGGHIGWAPLPPQAQFEPSVGFSPSDWDFGIGSNSWCFVPTPQFLSPRIERVIVPRPRNVTLIHNTANVTRYTVINRRVVNRSIDLDRFEGETRTRVVRHRVDETDRPLGRETSVRNGRVILFRPEVIRTTVAPPPPAVRPPRVGAPRDHRPEHRPPGTAPWEHRSGDRDRDWRDRGEWSGADRHSPNRPRSVEFEERDDGRPPMEQERRRQRPEAEQQTLEERRQEAARERARRWTEWEQRQPSEQGQDRQRTDQERTQRPAEREQARQQQIEQERTRRQAEQAQRQAEREARRQADQAQRQAEREQARQQQQKQAEQERQRRRNLPECKSLPPRQQQECR